MAITAQQVQQLLVAQVGDCPDSRLGINVALLWQQNAWAATISPPLQAAYTRLGLVDLALGYYREQVDTTLGETSLRYQQRVANLLEMRATVQGQVAQYQAMSRASRAGVAAPIAQTTPELPPDLRPPRPLSQYPDANSEEWQGDPYLSPLPVIG